MTRQSPLGSAISKLAAATSSYYIYPDYSRHSDYVEVALCRKRAHSNMAVTELACLRLSPPTTATTPSLLAHLERVKEAQEFYSGRFVRYYRCLEEPSTLFMFGGWPSIHTHMKEWIPSKENQDLLQLLKDEVSVDWMWHIDLDPTTRQSLDVARMLAIGKHMIKHGKKGKYGGLGEVKRALEQSVGDKRVVKGGWRLDRGFVPEKAEDEFEEGKDAQWVSFRCWESDEERNHFTQRQGLEEYGQLRDFVEVFDVKHAVRLEV